MYQIDLMSRVPIYEQIVEQTKRLILRGLLQSGERMPSVRNLSMELTVNPNTIQRAYMEMCNQGILCTAVGRGCFVAEEARTAIRNEAEDKVQLLKETATELWLAGYGKEQLFQIIEEACKERGKEIQ